MGLRTHRRLKTLLARRFFDRAPHAVRNRSGKLLHSQRFGKSKRLRNRYDGFVTALCKRYTLAFDSALRRSVH